MRPPLPRLRAITDERIARRPDLDLIAAALAQGGGSDLAFHARGRELTGLEHYSLSFQLSILPSFLFVNDRLDIALAVPTAGVQLGHGSLPVSAARALNPVWWITKIRNHPPRVGGVIRDVYYWARCEWQAGGAMWLVEGARWLSNNGPTLQAIISYHFDMFPPRFSVKVSPLRLLRMKDKR